MQELQVLPGKGGHGMVEPSAAGRFGDFGGRFVPESLIPACEELETAFRDAWDDPRFRAQLDRLLTVYAGRPTPLTPAWRLSAGARHHAAAEARGSGAHRLPQDQ